MVDRAYTKKKTRHRKPATVSLVLANDPSIDSIDILILKDFLNGIPGPDIFGLT